MDIYSEPLILDTIKGLLGLEGAGFIWVVPFYGPVYTQYIFTHTNTHTHTHTHTHTYIETHT